jgi:hypothetical protein
MDWTSVAKTVLTTGVIVSVLGYFFRQVFQQLLSRDLEKFKADLGAKHDIEIERLRNDLRIAASEHETRFTRLHETRMDAVAELYVRLVHAYDAFSMWLHPLQFGGNAAQEERRKQAWKLGYEFMEYFSEKRIYFEEALCRDIDEAVTEFKRAWVAMEAYPPGMPGRDEQWGKTWERFAGLLPSIRQQVERQFRDLIGVFGGEGIKQA